MYYLNRHGTQSGPFSEAQFNAMAASGRILPSDLVWKEGDPEWQVASRVISFAPAGPPPIPPASPSESQGSVYSPPVAPLRTNLPQDVPTYLVQSILLTFCCCIVFGIPAIVYAASVSGKLQAGDYAGAKVASDKAKFWCWMAFGFGLVANIAIALSGGLPK